MPPNSVVFSGDKIFEIFFEDAGMRDLIIPVKDQKSNKTDTKWKMKVRGCFEQVLLLYQKFVGVSES